MSYILLEFTTPKRSFSCEFLHPQMASGRSKFISVNLCIQVFWVKDSNLAQVLDYGLSEATF